MAKVVLIIADAVGFEAAKKTCGILEGLVEAKEARRYKMRVTLPSLSAPNYNTIHTGTAPIEHGITSNHAVPLTSAKNVFSETVKAGKTTGAMAHYNFSELYNNSPYDVLNDMEVDDPSKNIQHGRFYNEYGNSGFNLCIPSDYDIFARTTLLIKNHAPDYLLSHTFSADCVGHGHGGLSSKFYSQCYKIDDTLGMFMPIWREAGYRVLFTADHGMTEDGRHGGTSDIERHVPLYDVGHPNGGICDDEVSQLSLAPTMLSIMGITPPTEMTSPILD